MADTALDLAHAAMAAAPEDDVARLKFYERLADCELFLLLKQEVEAAADTVTPETVDVQGQGYVLVFDREERLVDFAGRAAAFVALSGRSLAQMLQGQPLGLGVNLDVAPSSILLPPNAIQWLHDTLGNSPDEAEAQIEEVQSPTGLPETLITALDTKLATAMGLAQSAYLVGVRYTSGGRGHLLAFRDAVPAAEDALALAVNEALTFSGIEAGTLDVAFLPAGNPLLPMMERVGLRFDLPQPQMPVTQTVTAPGSDPDTPPKLK